jgi:hypothetical protein
MRFGMPPSLIKSCQVNTTHRRLSIPQQSPIDLAKPLVLFHLARASLAPQTGIFFLV